MCKSTYRLGVLCYFVISSFERFLSPVSLLDVNSSSRTLCWISDLNTDATSCAVRSSGCFSLFRRYMLPVTSGLKI